MTSSYSPVLTTKAVKDETEQRILREAHVRPAHTHIHTHTKKHTHRHTWVNYYCMRQTTGTLSDFIYVLNMGENPLFWCVHSAVMCL